MIRLAHLGRAAKSPFHLKADHLRQSATPLSFEGAGHKRASAWSASVLPLGRSRNCGSPKLCKAVGPAKERKNDGDIGTMVRRRTDWGDLDRDLSILEAGFDQAADPPARFLKNRDRALSTGLFGV